MQFRFWQELQEAKKIIRRILLRGFDEQSRPSMERFIEDSDNGDGSPTGKLVMVLPIRYAIEFHVYNGVAGSEGAIGIRDDRNRFWPIAGMTCSQPATLPDGSVNEMNCRLLLRDSAVMLGKVAREIEGRIQTKWDDAKFFSPKVDA